MASNSQNVAFLLTGRRECARAACTQKGVTVAAQEIILAVSGAVVAVIGAVGTVATGLQNRRRTLDAEDVKRLAGYDAWEPKVRRYIRSLRATLSELGVDTDDPPPIGPEEVSPK